MSEGFGKDLVLQEETKQEEKTIISEADSLLELIESGEE